MKDDTIEVIGTATYTLAPVEYRLEARIETPTDEEGKRRGGPVPRGAFGEAMEAVAAAVVAKGFPEGDIVHDGTGGFGRWRGRRGMAYGQESRLVFRSDDAGTIMMIPVWLEGLDIGRLSLRFESQPVRYEDAAEKEVAAFARALPHARAIAAAMAGAEGRALATLIRAQDMRLGRESDERGYGGEIVFAEAAPPMGLEDREFGEEGERRSVTLRALYRVGDRAESKKKPAW